MTFSRQCRGYLAFLVATYFLSVACRGAFCASLAELTLTVDGSADPPGDRLDLSIGLTKDEPPLVIEVRAVVLSADHELGVEPVRASGERNRDKNGLFRVTLSMEAKPNLASIRTQVIVPYDDLDLSPGTYRIAYEVRGIQLKSIAFVQPTRLTEVEVVDKARKRLDLRRQEVRDATDERKVEALFSEQGRLIKRGITIHQPIAVRKIVIERHEVKIPGGFFRSEIDEVARGAEPSPPHATLREFEPQPKRQIYFATNRKRAEGKNAGHFGAELSSELRYGTCTVNIPITAHSSGQLELPLLNWWQARDPQRYFLVESTELASWDVLRDRILEQDRLLFVHGFSNTFDSAVLRTAQLHHDLRFPGHSMVFCWPADGAPGIKISAMETAYLRAEEKLDESVNALVQVLSRLSSPTEKKQTPRLHIIAHSLGCRLLLRAIARWEKTAPVDNNSSRPLATVILLAPDVDVSAFEQCLPSLVRSTNMLTYYYSSEDSALLASKRVHSGSAPVGLMPLFSTAVDTINADHANFPSLLNLGHLYYASSIPVLADLQLQLNSGYRPEKRQPPLARLDFPKGMSHWCFLVTAPEPPADEESP